MRNETPQTIYLRDYTPPPFLIDEVHLHFTLAQDETRVRSTLEVRRNPDAKESEPSLKLDGEELTLHAVLIDDRPLPEDDYEVGDAGLIIQKIPADRPFRLTTEVTINPKANTALSGLYVSNDVYCTQCEAEGFRRITFFPDRPDVLSRYHVTISSERASVPVMLSNGNLVETGKADDGATHYAKWYDPFPKPSYLFALVAGDLAVVRDRFKTMSGRDVALEIYVEHGKEDRCDWAMDSLKKSMKWDEEAFGREYDLDVFMIVAVSDFNMGAMENKGLNIFNDKFILARPDTATDQDYAHIESIIAHEYFHNWSGNRITCRDWFQLCLKEGFTVFRDQEFTSDLRSRAVKRISDVKTLRAHQFPEDAGPLAHPVRPQSFIEINNFYTATVYEKGAEICRMIKTLIGDEAFRRATDLYFERHDGEAATVEDFVDCMADASGRDLSQLFLWYNQAGTPELLAEGNYDKNRQSFDLTITQTIPDTPGQTDKAPHHIPLEIGLIGHNGEDCELTLEGGDKLERPVIELTQASQTFTFEGITSRPVPSLNRGFTAPVKLRANLPISDRLFLIEHDSDPFNRWESTQRVAQRLIIDAMEDQPASGHASSMRKFSDALASVLRADDLEYAFRALMITLPGETDLASTIGQNVDPQQIHDTRQQIAANLGRDLHDVLLDIWRDLAQDKDYSPDAENTGRRSLRHAALVLIAAADADEGAELAHEHFLSASNMTDMAGALAVLAGLDHARRGEALQAFYDRYRQDHLVVDKWFALNALWPKPGCAAVVKDLMQHDDFQLSRPNRVRALIGTFAVANPVCFNAPDGSGYELLADVIRKLDPINQQVAARLTASFKSWRALEPGRRKLAEGILRSLIETPGLSTDTHEILERSLR